MRIFTLVLVFSIISVARLQAARYFVDYEGGADASDGTSASTAWKHCPGDPAAAGNPATSALAPGDTVLFKGGVAYVLTGASGIALAWDGAAGKPITYDGNSAGDWGAGRAMFTDRHGGNAVIAFTASAQRHDLAFEYLDFGRIGGAASVPADTGAPVAPRFGGGIGFLGGASAVTIDDCVFHELGYFFAQRPMDAASIAGAGITARGGVQKLKISHCDFSRMASGCDFTEASVLDGVKLVDCTFHDSLVWPVNLRGEAPAGLSMKGCNVADNAHFEFNAWSGYGNSPRVEFTLAATGTRFMLGASAIASPAPTYQWLKNGVPIPGASGATFAITALTLADSGLYTVVATNSAGSASSNTVLLAVTPYVSASKSNPRGGSNTGSGSNSVTPPVITTQPASQAVPPLLNVTFTAAASGSGLSYQWRKNSVAIAGATSSTLTLPAVTLDDAGTYTVLVSNSAGSVTSSPAVLTVSTLPSVTVQPGSQFVSALSNATFTATASGSPAPSLQWFKNGVPLSGATATTLLLSGVTTNDAATYTAVATNSVGSTTSNGGVLAVTARNTSQSSGGNYPAVTQGPGKTLLTVAGAPVTHTFTVTGSTPRLFLVRAIGPSLAAFGMTGLLADPKLEIYAGSSLLSADDNWGGSDLLRNFFTQVGAFPLTDGASNDSVLLVGLPAGTYTAVVSGVNGSSGTVLLEFYEVP